jgi:hypothetical protein
MNTRPAVSQADRDVLENLGLPDILEHTDDDPVLLSHHERHLT